MSGVYLYCFLKSTFIFNKMRPTAILGWNMFMYGAIDFSYPAVVQ